MLLRGTHCCNYEEWLWIIWLKMNLLITLYYWKPDAIKPKVQIWIIRGWGREDYVNNLKLCWVSLWILVENVVHIEQLKLFPQLAMYVRWDGNKSPKVSFEFIRGSSWEIIWDVELGLLLLSGGCCSFQVVTFGANNRWPYCHFWLD